MQEPLLIFVSKLNSRLDYICKFLFRDAVQLPFAFTESEQKFLNYKGPKLVYGKPISEADLFIMPNGLLAATDIKPQIIFVENTEAYPYFFKTETNILEFDIFAASFYLISRYEEYLEYTPDIHNRFSYEQSIAFKNNFLHLPIVNIWLAAFAKKMQLHFASLGFTTPVYKHLRTYDIDMAFCYKHKGFKRQVGAIVSDLLKLDFKAINTRLQVLQNKQKDPFDTFQILSELHFMVEPKPIFFFLVGQHANFDKNISLQTKAMQNIISDISTYAEIGLHPSYESNNNVHTLISEKNDLENVIANTITKSRQHYIKNVLPATYINLIARGITQDYSMGYGSINGFRASTCTSHKWFNLETNKVENLQVFPFCWMDANSLYEQGYTVAKATEEFNVYEQQCVKYGGLFISIWHNSSIGNNAPWQGWQTFFINTFKKKENE